MMNSRTQKSLVEPLLKTEFHSKVAFESILRLNGKDYRLIGKHIRIGRAPDNDISIDNPSISRYHAMLSLSAEGYLIEDLKSRNGIRVNGSLIDKVVLSDEDTLQVGDVFGEIFFKSKERKKDETPILKSLSEEVSKSVKILDKRWKRSASKKKLAFIAMLALPLLVFGFMFLNKQEIESSFGLESAESVESVDLPSLVYEMTSKEEVAKCLEQEDLLNLKKARACFEALPQNDFIKASLSRVMQLQDDLTVRRYQEGEVAFKNYYFDIAIQKWQEVLLIADEESEYLSKAKLGMETAEQRKLLR